MESLATLTPIPKEELVAKDEQLSLEDVIQNFFLSFKLSTRKQYHQGLVFFAHYLGKETSIREAVDQLVLKGSIHGNFLVNEYKAYLKDDCRFAPQTINKFILTKYSQKSTQKK